jgi:hypothetical protein
LRVSIFGGQRILVENILKDRLFQAGDDALDVGNVSRRYIIPLPGLLAKRVPVYGEVDGSRKL